MSWIKDNKFMVALGGGTLVAVILLYVVGSQGAASYEKAKEDFDAAASEASTYEALPLYPKEANKDGKTKALDDYRKDVESLQVAFDAFRPKELKNISPQEFTDHLRAVNDEVRNAFEASGTKFPEAFFSGFENYKTNLAGGNSTGILDYQLSAIRNLMLALSKSGASELRNLYRPLLAEEEGRTHKPGESDVARPLPLEITFQGTEKAVRAFISSVIKSEGHFVVIRTIRVTNAKKDPPRAADAKFEKPTAKPAAGGAAADVFGGGFVLPGEEPKPDAPKPAEEATPAPALAPEPVAADSSRILAQVSGNEELQVFLRLDIMQFLPAKKLP
jgi:hypothetical protein